jgi:3'(2'), 5'-bisphosphate nucleotidase
VTETETDHELAARLAVGAGEVLVQLRAEMVARRAAPWDVMDSGDMAAHHWLVDALAAARPGDAVLSEEGRDSSNRLSNNRVWIIDPVDGTNEFGEWGRSDWAVHVALVEHGELTAGAVSLPALGVVFRTDTPPRPLPPLGDRRPRQVVSRNRVAHPAVMVAHALSTEVFRMGSAGAKAMAVVSGEADLYAHAGGMFEWDSAAPVAVARAAGFHVSRIDGSPLVYNRPDPWLPDLLICRPELADDVLRAVRG